MRCVLTCLLTPRVIENLDVAKNADTPMFPGAQSSSGSPRPHPVESVRFDTRAIAIASRPNDRQGHLWRCRLLDGAVDALTADTEEELRAREAHPFTRGLAELDGFPVSRVLVVPAARFTAVARARHVVRGEVIASSVA